MPDSNVPESTLSRETVLDLLNHEIEAAQGEEQRSGWSLWALAGALAGALLLIVDLWEKGGFSVSGTLAWLVILGVLADSVFGWVWTWTDEQTFRLDRRYRTFREFEHQKLGYAWRVVHGFALASAAIYVGQHVWTPAVVYVVCLYALTVLTSFSSVVMSSFEWPYQTLKPPSAWVSTAVVAVFVICGIGSAVSYGRILATPAPGAGLAELRIAALTIAGSFIVFRLLLGLRRPWAVRRLIRIRRELALGLVDVATAARGARLSLLGMEGANALEEYMLQTLRIHEDFWELDVHLTENLQAIHDALTALEAESGDSSRDTVRLDEIDEMIEEAERQVKASTKLDSRVEARMKRLDLLTRQIKREAPLSFARGVESLQHLYSDVVEQTNGMRTRLELDSSLLSEFRARVAQLRFSGHSASA